MWLLPETDSLSWLKRCKVRSRIKQQFNRTGYQPVAKPEISLSYFPVIQFFFILPFIYLSASNMDAWLVHPLVEGL